MFPDEATKIIYTASFLRDKAKEWFAPKLQNYLKSQEHREKLEDSTRACSAITRYLDRNLQAYGDIDKRHTAKILPQTSKQQTSVIKYHTSENLISEWGRLCG